MEEFRGIVLYSVERDNNLNGVYTNNHPLAVNRIYTETARLRAAEISSDGETETRTYDCFYFENERGVECVLRFIISNGIFDAIWSIGDRVIFEGQGFQMNDRQIAISYSFKA